MSAVFDGPVRSNKCWTVSPHMQSPSLASPLDEHMEPGPTTEDTIKLIRDVSYLCGSMSAFNRVAKDNDADHIFISFHNLEKVAAVSPYHCLGIVELNNVHLTRTIVNAIAIRNQVHHRGIQLPQSCLKNML